MIDKPLLAAVMTLLTLSLIMDYSLSVYTVSHFSYNDFHFFIRQSAAVFIGFVVMVILTKMNPDKWLVAIGLTLFFLFALLMVIMQFLPASLVNEVGGAKRWIHLGPLSIAPVEFFKVGFVFFLAWSFSRKLLNKNNMGYFEEIKMFAPYLIVFLFSVVVIAIFSKRSWAGSGAWLDPDDTHSFCRFLLQIFLYLDVGCFFGHFNTYFCSTASNGKN